MTKQEIESNKTRLNQNLGLMFSLKIVLDQLSIKEPALATGFKHVINCYEKDIGLILELLAEKE